MEEILKAVVLGTLNLSQEEFTALVKNGDEVRTDAKDVLSAKFADKIKSVEEAAKTKYDSSKENLINKAVKETTEKWIKPVQKVLGVSGEFESIEQFEQTVSEAVEGLRGSGKMKDEDVLKHQAVINLRNELLTQAQKDKEEAVTTVSTAFETFKKEAEYNSVVSKVREKVSDYWNGNKQNIITMGEDVLSNQQKLFVERVINGGSFKLSDEGNVMLVDEEGNLKFDEHKNPVKFDSFMQKQFEGYIPQKPASERSSTGSDSGGGDSDKTFQGKLPTTAEELQVIINSDIEYAQKKIATEHYAKNHG